MLVLCTILQILTKIWVHMTMKYDSHVWCGVTNRSQFFKIFCWFSELLQSINHYSFFSFRSKFLQIVMCVPLNSVQGFNLVLAFSPVHAVHSAHICHLKILFFQGNLHFSVVNCTIIHKISYNATETTFHQEIMPFSFDS